MPRPNNVKKKKERKFATFFLLLFFTESWLSCCWFDNHIWTWTRRGFYNAFHEFRYVPKWIRVIENYHPNIFFSFFRCHNTFQEAYCQRSEPLQFFVTIISGSLDIHHYSLFGCFLSTLYVSKVSTLINTVYLSKVPNNSCCEKPPFFLSSSFLSKKFR